MVAVAVVVGGGVQGGGCSRAAALVVVAAAAVVHTDTHARMHPHTMQARAHCSAPDPPAALCISRSWRQEC